MYLLNEFQSLPSIAQPGLSRVLSVRLQQCGSLHGFVLVEHGDTVTELEQVLGLSIVTRLFSDACYPDEDYVPRVELCDQELPGLYIEVRATSPG